jgi:hypothetical protein
VFARTGNSGGPRTSKNDWSWPNLDLETTIDDKKSQILYDPLYLTYDLSARFWTKRDRANSVGFRELARGLYGRAGMHDSPLPITAATVEHGNSPTSLGQSTQVKIST